MQWKLRLFILAITLVTVEWPLLNSLAMTPEGIQVDRDALLAINGGLAWSPDGLWLAVGTTSGVQIRTTNDLQLVEHFAEQIVVGGLDWSVNNQIAVGGEDGALEVWDVSILKRIHELSGHEQVSSVLWSPDGHLLASGGLDATSRVWDGRSGTLLYTSKHSDYHFASRSWSPDSQLLVTLIYGSGPGDITIWDAQTGNVLRAWPSHLAAGDLAWSPDGQLIAENGANKINLWHASTGTLVKIFDVGKDSSVVSLDWSPDSTRLASISMFAESNIGELYMTYATQIWDVEVMADKPILISDNVILTRDAFVTNALEWSPDGIKLAATSDDGKVFIWDVATCAVLATYNGYQSILLEGFGVRGISGWESQQDSFCRIPGQSF